MGHLALAGDDDELSSTNGIGIWVPAFSHLAPIVAVGLDPLGAERARAEGGGVTLAFGRGVQESNLF